MVKLTDSVLTSYLITMSNSNINTQWQVSYWTKMSYQPNIENSSQSEDLRTKKPNWNTSIVSNCKNERNVAHDRISFAAENEEFLNPLTKHWRESLRTHKQKYTRYSSAPKESNKQWLEKEYRKESQKLEVLESFKSASQGILSKSSFLGNTSK